MPSTKQCQYEGGCTITKACFNMPGESDGIRCAQHKKEEMVDVVHKTCEKHDCYTRPSFNFPNEKVGLRCVTHKKERMIDVVNRKCKIKDCPLRPDYNLPGQTVGLCCNAHKEDDMIDVVNRRCKTKGCTRRPTFNLPDQKTAKYCITHKENGMVDVINRKCKTKGCTTRPTFNLPDQITAEYCTTHKKNGMIDVVNRKCEVNVCNIISRFNSPGQTIGRFCKKHAEEFLSTYEDVVTRKCKHGKPIGCCSELECMGSKICMLCCERWRNRAYKLTYKPDPTKDETKTTTICATCHWKIKLIELLRDAKTPAEANKILKQKRYVKIKEVRSTKDVLDAFPKNTWCRQVHTPLCDDLVPDKRHFTDIEWDLSELFKFIFEIDEHQHRSMRCDMPRNFNIVAANVGQYITFIRYNPDNYKYNDETVKGMFTIENEPTEAYDERMSKVIDILKSEHTRAVGLERKHDELVKKVSLNLLTKLSQSKLTEAQEAKILTKIQAKSTESLIRIVFINYDENSDAVKEAIEKVGERQVVAHWV